MGVGRDPYLSPLTSGSLYLSHPSPTSPSGTPRLFLDLGRPHSCHHVDHSSRGSSPFDHPSQPPLRDTPFRRPPPRPPLWMNYLTGSRSVSQSVGPVNVRGTGMSPTLGPQRSTLLDPPVVPPPASPWDFWGRRDISRLVVEGTTTVKTGLCPKGRRFVVDMWGPLPHLSLTWRPGTRGGGGSVSREYPPPGPDGGPSGNYGEGRTWGHGQRGSTLVSSDRQPVPYHPLPPTLEPPSPFAPSPPPARSLQVGEDELRQEPSDGPPWEREGVDPVQTTRLSTTPSLSPPTVPGCL